MKPRRNIIQQTKNGKKLHKLGRIEAGEQAQAQPKRDDRSDVANTPKTKKTSLARCWGNFARRTSLRSKRGCAQTQQESLTSHRQYATHSSPHVSRCKELPASLLAVAGEDISLAAENVTGWTLTISRAGAFGDGMDFHVTDWARPISRGVTGGDVKELNLTGWALTISRLRIVGDDIEFTVTGCVLASSRTGVVGDDRGLNVTGWAMARSRARAAGDDMGLNATGWALASSREGVGDARSITGWASTNSRDGMVGDGTDFIRWTPGWKPVGTVGVAAQTDLTPSRGDLGADGVPAALAGISLIGGGESGLDVETSGLPSTDNIIGEGDGGLSVNGLPTSNCSVSGTIS